MTWNSWTQRNEPERATPTYFLNHAQMVQAISEVAYQHLEAADTDEVRALARALLNKFTISDPKPQAQDAGDGGGIHG